MIRGQVEVGEQPDWQGATQKFKKIPSFTKFQ